MGFFSRLWESLNPHEMTDDEIEVLNQQIAEKMQWPSKKLYVSVVSSSRLLDLVPHSPNAEAWGLALPNGVVLVRRKWRHILAHEIAHVYGASEQQARQFEDF